MQKQMRLCNGCGRKIFWTHYCCSPCAIAARLKTDNWEHTEACNERFRQRMPAITEGEVLPNKTE